MLLWRECDESGLFSIQFRRLDFSDNCVKKTKCYIITRVSMDQSAKAG